ncbi:MAG: GNAT family N-acetyltransferase [Candidatus Magasanikbacteria bacterium]|nr:GNAT family N-acetyltransferase [Candidatus Magasanikbacteria bacterium]
MRLRLLKKSDIPAAVAIIRQNFSREFARRARRELADMFGSAAIKPIYIVAEEAGQIVGLVAYMQSWMDYDVYEIFWVNVHPSYLKRSIGKRLVQAAIRQIKKQRGAALILLTARAVAGLPVFYQKQFGFKTVQKFSNRKYHLMAASVF